ncbi:hypothetical protein cyc_07988 [Cyclospora cayetanensis]|uniref:RAP domain-containing protein n=1 Tax=Cyclospora cayetanensis TaxID=88456 RepID=A0A1D3D1K6_9EIME|nr:hypothetical protein cyc_07988 [Cyclospora cayetanensis]
MQSVGEEAVLKASMMRPGDLIKVAVSLAKLGVSPPSLRERLSDALLPVLRDAPALQFRGCMHPLAVLGMYTQPLQMLVMERFSKVFISCRPPHLEKALQTAVALRVLQPQIWAALPRRVRQFYARLSLRRIPHPIRRPSAFHWEVSDCLAALNTPHRNTFQVLSELGWDIRRVQWFDWALLEGKPQKIAFLRNLRSNPPLPAHLPDPLPALSSEEVQQRLRLVKQQQEQRQLESCAIAAGAEAPLAKNLAL